MSDGTARVDLGALRFDGGAHLLIKRGLRNLAPGERLLVCGDAPDLAVHARAWCRAEGHRWEDAPGLGAGIIVRGHAVEQRWHQAESAGLPDPSLPNAIAQRPPGTWGLAARGALVEAGVPDFGFSLVDKDVLWADELPRLYAQAAASQWDPETAIDWSASFTLPEEIEEAVVQVMTYLIENETAALLVPARFLARLHPHFKEVMQLLAIQAADEARHIEVFTRRATLRGRPLGTSSAGGQRSLKTLLDEPDFALAFFLLSVLGEGSFLSLLWFLRDHAPDPVTERVAQLAAQDEARHVAFGMAHLKRHASLDPHLRGRLRGAIERRYDELKHTSGLNADVFDALCLLAAKSWQPEAIGRGFEAVTALVREMDEGRQRRLQKLGFSPEEAAALSALHTRNFM